MFMITILLFRRKDASHGCCSLLITPWKDCTPHLGWSSGFSLGRRYCTSAPPAAFLDTHVTSRGEYARGSEVWYVYVRCTSDLRAQRGGGISEIRDVERV